MNKEGNSNRVVYTTRGQVMTESNINYRCGFGSISECLRNSWRMYAHTNKV